MDPLVRVAEVLGSATEPRYDVLTVDGQEDQEDQADASPAGEHGLGGDPVGVQLRAAAQDLRDAQRRIRLLLAWAREYGPPRRYTLATLAEWAEMSFSGVRTAYSHDDVHEVALLLGTWCPDPECPEQLPPGSSRDRYLDRGGDSVAPARAGGRR